MTERCSRYRAHDFIISFYLSRCAKIKCRLKYRLST
nr:MAG TPA: hypothetical protein [Microviridae sp.]